MYSALGTDNMRDAVLDGSANRPRSRKSSMSQALKKSILLLPLMLIVGSYPATAQITGTPVSLPERPSGVNSVAFDSVNQVYLVTLAGSGRVIAKFLSKAGAQIGGVFAISVPNEAPYMG